MNMYSHCILGWLHYSQDKTSGSIKNKASSLFRRYMSNEIVQKALTTKTTSAKADHYRTYLGKKDKPEDKPVEESALEK